MASEEDLILNVIEKTTGNALSDGADDLDHLGNRVDHANKSFRDLGDSSGFVDKEIARLKSHIRDLGVEIDRTGNTSLFKDIKTDKSQLRQFENLAKALNPVGQSAGKEFNKGFLASMGELGSGLRGAMIPAAVGAVAVLSPIIGAAIAGAVVGVVGLGGIAGGIAAAAQDPKVKAAASVFGAEISREFALDGQVMVEPAIGALDILRKGFADLHLEDAFAKVAPFVDDLSRGIVGLVQSAMPGLNRALDASGPALELLAQELPQVGEAFGNMIGDIAESKGALEGLRFVLEFIESTFRVTGSTIAWLSDRFHDLVGAGAAFTGAFEDITAKLAFVAPPLALVSNELAKMNNHLEELQGKDSTIRGIGNTLVEVIGTTSNAVRTNADLKVSMDAAALAAKAEADSLAKLKKSLDDAFNAMMSLDEANLAIARDTLAFKQALDDHKTSLSLNTAEGQRNRGMLLGLVQDYERQRDAAIQSGTSVEKASAKFREQVGALEKLATSLGFTKSQVDALLGKYKQLMAQPNITKTITYKFVTVGRPPAVAPQIGGSFIASAFADGGWVDAPAGVPVPAIVHGGEFVLSREMLKSSVMPRTSAPGTAPTGGSQRIELVVRNAGDAASEAIGELLRRFVYIRGGDPVAVLGS